MLEMFLHARVTFLVYKFVSYDILGTPPGAPGAPGLGGPCCGLGPWNPNLGGGVRSFLASLDLLRTTLE